MPVTSNDYDRAAGFANAAMALLKRANIPPYPMYYELFYLYATGYDPDLTERINALFNQDGTITLEQATACCEDFLGIEDMDARLRALSRSMNQKITDVNTAIDSAMASANSYSGSLQQASGDLDRGIDAVALKALSDQLLKETRRMQEMNRALEIQLQNSRGDIMALERDLSEVRRESMLDPLTRIPNRKCFDTELAAEMEAAASDAPLSLLLFDIDHFKVFNDTYGHLTGDQVLRLVAQVLRANLKGRDVPARFGGEEFAVILPRTALADATAIAGIIREAVQSKELLKRSTNEKLGRITVSVGVAQYRGADTAASLIERADRCLYAAKNAGRNRVMAENALPDDAESAQTAAS